MIHAFGKNDGESIASLSDYDLALLVLKMLDSYTADRAMKSIAKGLTKNIENDSAGIRLSPIERRVAEKSIPEVIQRWHKYRVRTD